MPFWDGWFGGAKKVDAKPQAPAVKILGIEVGDDPSLKKLSDILKADPDFENSLKGAATRDPKLGNFLLSSASTADGKKDLKAIVNRLDKPEVRSLVTEALNNVGTKPGVGFDQFKELTDSISKFDKGNIDKSFERVNNAFVGLGVPANKVSSAINAQVNDEFKDILKDDGKMAKLLSKGMESLGMPKGISNAIIGGLSMIVNMFKTIFNPNGEFMGPWAKLMGKVFGAAQDKGETLVRSNTPDPAPRPAVQPGTPGAGARPGAPRADGPAVTPGAGTPAVSPPRVENGDTPAPRVRPTSSEAPAYNDFGGIKRTASLASELTGIKPLSADERRERADNAVKLDLNAGVVKTAVSMSSQFGGASYGQDLSPMGPRPENDPRPYQSRPNPGMGMNMAA